MILLELVKRTDERYQQFRNRHYVLNKGCHGQQLHYLVFYENVLVGIISGASAVYGCAPRDKFFNLSKVKVEKQAQLNQIISNVVFRLECRKPNLASQVLSMWRKRIKKDWEFLYQISVIGFETFVIPEDRGGLNDRRGTLYIADNWTKVGITSGNTKMHDKSTGSAGLNNKHTRRSVEKKIILCIRVKGVKLIKEYASSWKDKEKSKLLSKRRKTLFTH